MKCPVEKLLARGQRNLLKEWLRYVESLSDEEDMVHAYEPDSRRNISDDEEKRSLEDLTDCQVGSRKFQIFQVGREKEMRLSKSIGISEVISYQ